MAVLKRLSIFALILVRLIALNADDNSVAYRFTSLIGFPVKSLNGVKGSGRSMGLSIAVLSVSKSCNHESFSIAENSPL